MSKRAAEKLQKLAYRLNHQFTDNTLLQAAVTHRSSTKPNNERLEFLGDSILNVVITTELYLRFPKALEGELTRMRAALVKGETLAEIAKALEIGEYLNLGIGEQKSGGHQRESILANALEAIIGAIYLDAGIETVKSHILAWYNTRLNTIVPGALEKDAKTRLQEYLQAKRLPLPEYQVLEIAGDSHDPLFQVQCVVSLLKAPLIGKANTRRKAEQNAAEAALKVLKDVG